MIGAETKTKNETIQHNADNVMHITCLSCSPRQGDKFLMLCGVWDILHDGYYEPGKEIYCPLCESQIEKHDEC